MNSIDKKFAKMSRATANKMSGTGTGLKKRVVKRKKK